MAKTGKKIKSVALCASIALMAGTLVASQLLPVFGNFGGENITASGSGDTSSITELSAGTVDTHVSDFLDKDVVYTLPEGIDPGREISVIVQTADSGVMSAFDAQSAVSRYATVAEFASSSKGTEITSRIARRNNEAKGLIERAGIPLSYGASYNVLMGGFEVVVKAGDYTRITSALKNTDYAAYISEEYERAEAQLVENDVNVHEESGIFNSEGVGYDGSGVVVAVLDTGLDYTHTAFDEERFTSTQLTMTPESINGKVSKLRAAEYTPGLTAANVYISKKVPYAYDYADHDADVYPLESEHGTHVSGVIVGKDDEITGVAPNAQLVSMKVFSDKTSGARTSWLLAALEDCVTLDVDVINMSLGSSSGFTEESGPEEFDEKQIYSSIAEHGISLVAAAGNDYNATFGSEKNGNLGLTTNPDSAVIGSPGSYTSALAVASISGIKTPYLLYEGQIVYFTESADQSSETRHFVEGILPAGVTEQEFEYVTVPGIGRSADYGTLTGEYDVKGKIALVRRGDTTFEDKARIAQSKGAIGVIIYNNVSGDITMTVGTVKIPVCSVSRDNGELLSSVPSGKIKVSTTQVAGPFMSDFSSWGPTPDLRIKPEITAHGGDIYSSVPGQAYDRLSGTSMAAPNQAGVTALVRQYVQKTFPNATRVEQLQYTNQIMMSTADIAKNTNNLPFSVRKQGAGLANLIKATTTPAYISTFARDDEAVANQSPDRFTDELIDKAKIEYGDDKAKTGVYKLKFNLNNISDSQLSYDLDAIVMSEGISETKTYKGAQTVTQEGYMLDGAKVTVESVTGGSNSGNVVTVGGKGCATVTVTIELGESDKQYLDQMSDLKDSNGQSLGTFENGMYVEGYITLKSQQENGVDLNVPYLAFYGDWTKAPIFDLDYFETDKDARDDSIATLDKTLPDAWATIPLGGLYQDYRSELGSFYFVQDPASTPQVSASRDHIALTNQEGETGGVNQIYSIYAGLLRGAKRVEMSVTDSVTGEVIWTKTEWNQRKSYNGGGSIYPSFIDVDFHMTDYDLQNNTKYIFRAEAVLDYPGEQNNAKSVFEFPFVADFQAPIVSDAEFYTEYDSQTKKNRLFARLYVYDNHYTMCASIGQLLYADPGADARYTINSFGSYMTPVFSDFNSTSEIVVELTDYVSLLPNSVNPNTISVALFDYAMNQGVYEIRIPDSVKGLYFKEMDHEDGTPLGADEFGVKLSPNETYVLEPVLYPSDEWRETLVYTSDNEDAVRVVNGKLLAVAQGTATITATSYTDNAVKAQLTVKVLGPGEQGYTDTFTKPVADIFRLTGYKTDFAFYRIVSTDREIGETGSDMAFSPNASSYSLSMFPSEKVTITHELVAYYPETTKIIYESGNENFVRVDENGQITAVAQGTTSVTVRVMTVGENDTLMGTLYDKTISVTVKDPYERNGPYLSAYRGGGMQSYTDSEGNEHEHAVVIPEEMGFTEISQYAFSGYHYIPKDLSAGDVINEEDPDYTKIWYFGDNKDVEEVVIPEGVKVIGNYAFAGMTGLKRVVLPSTLNKIAMGAFYGCTALEEIVGLEYVKFINQDAFFGPAVLDEAGRVIEYDAAPLNKVTAESFANIVAIGDQAFRGTELRNISLPESAQSIGAYTFADTELIGVEIKASKIKLGNYAFAGDEYLFEMDVNASVIPDGVFSGCSALNSITLGKDVESIGPGAFAGTAIASFTVEAGNPNFKEQTDKSYLLSADGKTLLHVAPATNKNFSLSGVEEIGTGAFSSFNGVTSVTMPDVTRVKNYGFYGCGALTRVALGQLTEIGDYAFAETGLTALPTFAASLDHIGNFAFMGSALRNVTINGKADGSRFTIGDGAFSDTSLSSVTIGDNVTVGTEAFRAAFYVENVAMITRQVDSTTSYTQYYTHIRSSETLTKVTIGKNVEVGPFAFACNTVLQNLTVGENSVIGEGAFYGCSDFEPVLQNGRVTSYRFVSLTADLSKAKSIGSMAFSGPASTVVTVYSNGNEREAGSLGWYQAPQIMTVDLSSAETLGEGAFAYNRILGDTQNSAAAGLTLGENLTEIPALAFAYSSITELDFKNVTKVGEAAFLAAGLTEADLSKMDEIGAAAFAYVPLEEVTLKEGVRIGAEAFYGDAYLETVNGLDKASAIGSGAFASTSIAGDISLAATELGDFAFMSTGITSVDFTAKLEVLGENPFAGCPLKPFAKTEEEKFHGQTVGTNTITNFVINEEAGIEVIDGILYKKTPSGGRVLVTYPMTAEAREVIVADGTVRISAFAFAGSNIYAVTFPRTVLALGDKAFYQCANLGLVTFKSLNAPILEEQYDESYADLPLTDANGYEVTDEAGRLVTHLPSQPAYSIFTGDVELTDLGILKYRTMSFDPVNFFFGANFVDYIGQCAGDLVMVRPSNGTGYDSFIFEQYFGATIDGAVAPDERTLAAMAAIAALPDEVTLADKPLVVEARRLYDLIVSDEQRGIVFKEGYQAKLQAAENAIEFFENQQGGNTPENPPTDNGNRPDALIITLSVLVGVFGAAAITAFVLLFLTCRKAAKQEGTEEEEAADGSEEPVDTEKSSDPEEPVDADGFSGGDGAPRSDDPVDSDDTTLE